jgi:hypothetical protein
LSAVLFFKIGIITSKLFCFSKTALILQERKQLVLLLRIHPFQNESFAFCLRSATVAPFWEYAKKSPYVAATAPATAVVEKLITTTTASASSLEKAREYLAAVEWNLDM